MSFVAWALPAAELTEDFFAAARKNDVATIKALLAKGVDVNAKWRYDTTALMMACRYGHLEAVKTLLDAGAKVNVKDTFYGMTPVSSALKHVEIVKLLLERGSEEVEAGLMAGIQHNNLDLVKVALGRGGLKKEALSNALGRAIRVKNEPIIEALKQAGAVPPPQPDFAVSAETLSRYAGAYREESGNEIKLAVADGKLTANWFGQNMVLGAFDNVTFQPLQADQVRIVFQVDGDRVTGLTVRQGNNATNFRRMEAK